MGPLLMNRQELCWGGRTYPPPACFWRWVEVSVYCPATFHAPEAHLVVVIIIVVPIDPVEVMTIGLPDVELIKESLPRAPSLQ